MSLETAMFVSFLGASLIGVMLWCRSLILKYKKLEKESSNAYKLKKGGSENRYNYERIIMNVCGYCGLKAIDEDDMMTHIRGSHNSNKVKIE